MNDSIRIFLPIEWQQKVQAMPETGVGYHAVSIEMVDGTRHELVCAINGEYFDSLFYIDPTQIHTIAQLIAMKTFILTIYKGSVPMQTKTVQVSSLQELKNEKGIFWMELPYKRGNPGNWMGVKRAR